MTGREERICPAKKSGESNRSDLGPLQPSYFVTSHVGVVALDQNSAPKSAEQNHNIPKQTRSSLILRLWLMPSLSYLVWWLLIREGNMGRTRGHFPLPPLHLRGWLGLASLRRRSQSPLAGLPKRGAFGGNSRDSKHHLHAPRSSWHTYHISWILEGERTRLTERRKMVCKTC